MLGYTLHSVKIISYGGGGKWNKFPFLNVKNARSEIWYLYQTLVVRVLLFITRLGFVPILNVVIISKSEMATFI